MGSVIKQKDFESLF